MSAYGSRTTYQKKMISRQNEALKSSMSQNMKQAVFYDVTKS